MLDVRFNGMVQYGDIAGRDFTTDNRWGLAGNVVYHPTANFKLTANYSHTYLWGIPDFGVPTNQVTRQPVTERAGISRNIFYGAVNRDFTKSTQDMGTLDAEWKLNDHVTLENKFRASHSLLNYIGTIPENPSATGATAPYSSTLTFFSGYVQLNAQSRYEPVTVINDQPQVSFKFNTGEIQHTAILGGEFSNERISIQGYSGLTSELTTGPVAFASTGAPIVSVYNPPNNVYGSDAIALAGNPLNYKVNTRAGYLMDTANYHDFIILNARNPLRRLPHRLREQHQFTVGGRRHPELERRAVRQAGEDRQHLLRLRHRGRSRGRRTGRNVQHLWRPCRHPERNADLRTAEEQIL